MCEPFINRMTCRGAQQGRKRATCGADDPRYITKTITYETHRQAQDQWESVILHDKLRDISLPIHQASQCEGTTTVVMDKYDETLFESLTKFSDEQLKYIENNQEDIRVLDRCCLLHIIFEELIDMYVPNEHMSECLSYVLTEEQMHRWYEIEQMSERYSFINNEVQDDEMKILCTEFYRAFDMFSDGNIEHAINMLNVLVRDSFSFNTEPLIRGLFAICILFYCKIYFDTIDGDDMKIYNLIELVGQDRKLYSSTLVDFLKTSQKKYDKNDVIRCMEYEHKRPGKALSYLHEKLDYLFPLFDQTTEDGHQLAIQNCIQLMHIANRMVSKDELQTLEFVRQNDRWYVVTVNSSNFERIYNLYKFKRIYQHIIDPIESVRYALSSDIQPIQRIRTISTQGQPLDRICFNPVDEFTQDRLDSDDMIHILIPNSHGAMDKAHCFDRETILRSFELSDAKHQWMFDTERLACCVNPHRVYKLGPIWIVESGSRLIRDSYQSYFVAILLGERRIGSTNYSEIGSMHGSLQLLYGLIELPLFLIQTFLDGRLTMDMMPPMNHERMRDEILPYVKMMIRVVHILGEYHPKLPELVKRIKHPNVVRWYHDLSELREQVENRHRRGTLGLITELESASDDLLQMCEHVRQNDVMVIVISRHSLGEAFKNLVGRMWVTSPLSNLRGIPNPETFTWNVREPNDCMYWDKHQEEWTHWKWSSNIA